MPKLHNQGFSIIEVLVAIGIMGVMMAICAEMFRQQLGQTHVIAQKIAINDVKMNVQSIFLNSINCNCAAAAFGTFDASATDVSLDLPLIPGGCNGATSLTSNQVVSGTAGQLSVGQIQLTHILSTGTPNDYNSTVVIPVIDAKKFPFAPITLSLRFRTDPSSPAKSKKILSCESADLTSTSFGASSTAIGTLSTTPKSTVQMYQCPNLGTGALGGGTWGFYGCQGQITNQDNCLTIESPNHQSFACLPLGLINIY